MKNNRVDVRRSLLMLVAVIMFFTQSSITLAESVDVQGKAPEQNVSLYEVSKDLPIIIDGKQLAIIKANTYVFLEKNSDGELFIQFGMEKLKVDEQNVTLLNQIPEGVSYETYQDKNIESLNYDRHTAGTDDQAEVCIQFHDFGNYPIYQQTNEKQSILVGNRMFNIVKETPENTGQAPVEPKNEVVKVETKEQPKSTTEIVPKPQARTLVTENSPVFTGQEKYFKATTADVAVYVIENGGRVKASELVSGQEYIIFAHSGNWLKIRFGNGYGYIRKSEVVPSNGATIKNTNIRNSKQFFTPNRKLAIYENMTDKSVQFAYIEQGRTYPIIKKVSANWLQISFSGRIGYVYAPYVTMSVTNQNKFFKVAKDQAPIYVVRDNKYVVVGSLSAGQEYPMLGVTSNGKYITIKYGNANAYIDISAGAASNGSTLKNVDLKLKSSSRTLKAKNALPVYDNTSGKLVEFARILPKETYPIVKQTSANWIMVSLAGRTGYVYIPQTIINLSSSDKYFSTYYSKTPVYVNNKIVANLPKDQEFPIMKHEGSFVRIQYGKGTALVRKSHVSTGTGSSIKNLNKGNKGIERSIVPTKALPVYDNTSGKLVEFAKLEKGASYDVIRQSSLYWYEVSFGGRIGYINKLDVVSKFKTSDQYFQPLTDEVKAYTTKSTEGTVAVELIKGQKYKIKNRSNGYIHMAYGNNDVYVLERMVYPTTGSGIKNGDTGSKNSNKIFKTERNVEIFDNTTSPMSVYAKLQPGQSYPIIMQTSENWLKVSFGGRIGYIYKPHVKFGPQKNYTSTNYDLSLDEILKIQLSRNPQTDNTYKNYVAKQYITLNPKKPGIGEINTDSLNVRGGPGTNYWVVGMLKKGQSVEIVGQSGDWYEIIYPYMWKNASPNDVKYYLNPSNFSTKSVAYFQFLKLSQPTGLNTNEVNKKILAGKGILEGKASAFITGAKKYNVNEMYLISHSILETGNGTSELAKGILVSKVNGKDVPPKVVYNVFGIGAYDSCPKTCGSERAYTEGWFTPEAAIIGGAKFIGESYINNPYYKQDTLYKMRWNPSSPGQHQYATDIGWAYKQVYKISELYSLLDTYEITFDVPVYK